MSSAASIRSDASSPPAIRLVSRVCVCGDLGVAELRAKDGIEDAGGLGPDRRPAVAVETGERRRGRSPTGPAAAVSRSAARSSGVSLGREGRVDRDDVALERERLFGGDGDRLLAREVVLRVDVVAGILRGLRLGLDVAVELDGARRDDVASRRGRRP